MSPDGFRQLTPHEFDCACQAFHAEREVDEQARWERMRLLAAITIQPHVKGRMSPQRLVPLPSDRKPQGRKRSETVGNGRKRSDADARTFEELTALLGDTY